MFQREKTGPYMCPNCGRELRKERGELRCADHGVFFAYGPNLIVRAAARTERDTKVQLPWEKAFAK